MTQIERESRDKELLLPENIEDYVTQYNPVHVIEVFVNRLGMGEFKNAYPIRGNVLDTTLVSC